MTKISEKPDGIFIKNLKKDFFYGLMVILPIIATIWLVWFFINLISGPMSTLFGQKIPPLVSFILSMIFIMVIGIAARNLIGKIIINFIENFMDRLPIINTVYKSTKQIINAFRLQNKKLLSAVLVEYPRKGVWALAFITRDTVTGLTDPEGNELGENKCTLFVPTTPNPTSGYFIFVDKDEIQPLAMSVEESIKLLMSAGVLIPKKTKKKAKESPTKPE